MNGPEHYAAAEVLEGDAALALASGDLAKATLTIARAQLHVALAQVAATIDAALEGAQQQRPGYHTNQWAETLK